MKPKVLLQIDHDPLASSFDSIVALDAGVDHLLTYAAVKPLELESLIHGGIFTRGSADLHRTAAFFGGSNVEKAMELFTRAQRCFMGPFQFSIMADPNGSNTTAAAAVLSAQRHLNLEKTNVVVLAGTGPVGQRIGLLASLAGATVTIGSRNLQRAADVARRIEAETDNRATPAQIDSQLLAGQAIASADVVFAAGAAGVELLETAALDYNPHLRVVLDTNAIPPLGITAIQAGDRGALRGSTICYGALAIGQLKMKIHKRCLEHLFETNNAILDTPQIYQIGAQVAALA
jgi:hypothetical protein